MTPHHRNLAVEARMLVAAAGGRANRPFVRSALCDLYGATPDIADAWIDHAVNVGLLRHTSDAHLGLAGPLNQRHNDSQPKRAVIAAMWQQAHQDQTPAWTPERIPS